MYFGEIAPAQFKWVKKTLAENHLSTEGLFEGNVVLYAIFHDNNPVAMGALEIEEKLALMRSVCTQNEEKNKGLGTMVVQHILNEAKKQNLESLYLLTDTAEMFFTKLGFTTTERNQLPESFENKPLVKNVCTINSGCMHIDLKI